MTTTDELMRLVELTVMDGLPLATNEYHAALRTAIEEVVVDAERYRMLSRMLFHGDFEVGEAYVTMKIVGACPCPADLDREVDAVFAASPALSASRSGG